MPSDKSMYWLAAGVLALGIGTRYGHGNSANEWASCVFQRTHEAVDRVADRAGDRVMVLNDRQACANDRAAAAVARAQARIEAAMARREAAVARVQARVVRLDKQAVRIQINDME